MRTVYIKEEQEKQLRKYVISEEKWNYLLTEENSSVKKKVKDIIRQYCSNYVSSYLDTPLSQLPMGLRHQLNPGGRPTAMWTSVNNNPNENKFIDFLKVNLYDQLGTKRDKGPWEYVIGGARILCQDLGFYSFSPDTMRGGDIIKFSKLLRTIHNHKEIFIGDGPDMDRNLNGMNYGQFMHTFADKYEAWKTELTNKINSEDVVSTGNYTIVSVDDIYNGNGCIPTGRGRALLNRLDAYTDWCICGSLQDFEYPQYTGGGGKVYIMMKRGFEDIQKQTGQNCPLDEYGLSLICVIVGPDGMPDNITTRWNHENGGENPEGLSTALDLQRVTKVKYFDVFKPRSSNELSQMHMLNEDDEKPSAMDQVHNKVNAGIMDAVTGGGMMEEASGNIETWYRGYNSKYGSERTHLLWLTDDISYARAYGNRVEEVLVDMDKLNAASIYEMDGICGYEIDYYEGIDKEDAEKAMQEGVGGYEFEVAENEGYYCLCLWDKSAIISRRELPKEEFDNIEPIDGYDNPAYDTEMKEMFCEGLISENSNDRKVNKYIKEKFGLTDFQDIRNKVMEIYEAIPYSRVNSGRYLLGVLRLLFEDNLPKEEYSALNRILYKIAHCNYYEKEKAGVLDPNFSGQSFDELKEKLFVPDFEGVQFSTAEKQIKVANGFTVTRIDSYDEMNARCDGEWCISYDDTLWYELVEDGTVYLVENEGLIDKYDKEYEKDPEYWQDLGYMAGEEDEMDEKGFINSDLAWTNKPGSWKFPYDYYGLSRFVVIVYKDLFTCYSRWNMPNEFDGDYLTKQQIEKLLGVKFEDVFKPLGKPENAAWEYDQFGRKVPYGSVAREAMAEGAEPEADEYKIGGEGGNNEYFHAVNESSDTIQQLMFGLHDKFAYPFITLIKLDGSNSETFVGAAGEEHGELMYRLAADHKISREDYGSLWNAKRNEQLSGRIWIADDCTAISFYSYPNRFNEIYKKCLDIADIVKKNLSVDFNVGEMMVDLWPYNKKGDIIVPLRWLGNGVAEIYLPYTQSCVPEHCFTGEYQYRVKTTKGTFLLDWKGDDVDGSGVINESKIGNFDFKKYFKPIAEFMRKDGLNVYPYPKIKLNWEPQDGLFIKTGYYEPESKTIVIFCDDRHPKDILRTFCHEMIHHSQNLDGVDLNFSSKDDVKDNERLEEIESEAYLKGNVYFRKWTEYAKKDSKDVLQEGRKKVVKNDKGEVVPEKCDKCGGDVVCQIHGEPVYVCKECGKYFGTMPFNLHEGKYSKWLIQLMQRRDPDGIENLSEETDPSEVDLSSFNIKTALNPKFWKDGHLDSRIRMRLLDIADDFIEFLGVDWVKPDDIIMTGSLANYNWNKKFSDIDLHVLIDYSKVDKRKDFVDNYFYSQKKLWNDEHQDLKIFGFPVELYVQDTKEKHSSTGVYSLDKDKWIVEPEREKLSGAKINKTLIKNKVAYYIDKIEELLTIYKTADGDYKIRKISERADKLFDDIKSERRSGLEKSDNEISNGNLIFKCLRRLGYIEKLVDLKSETYDKLNSLS